MSKRKTFSDLGVDEDALIAAAAGTEVDRRRCSHGRKPKIGCSQCWVHGWLHDDRRNPAHPYYARTKPLIIRG